MKKSNNKGFMLAETLAVTVVVMIIFVTVYASFMPMQGEYERRLSYNDVTSQYAAFYMLKLYLDENITIPSTGYVRLYDGGVCKNISSSKQTLCNNLARNLGIEDLIITNHTISDNLKNNYTGVLKNYISYLPSYTSGGGAKQYRLIIKTDHGYATTSFNFNEDDYPRMVGDVNNDKKITMEDLIMVRQHVLGVTNLTGEKFKAGDVNADNVIDDIDIAILRRVTMGDVHYKNLPFTRKYGDVNNDGRVDLNDKIKIRQQIEDISTLTGDDFAAADVNIDGVVDDTDNAIVGDYILGRITKLPFLRTYGDVNNDGDITLDDVTLITQHVNNISLLGGANFIVADVNSDGEVDAVDAKIVEAYILHREGYDKLPIKIDFGDIDGDGRITMEDTIALRQHILGVATLKGIEFATADVNMDGVLDDKDVEIMQSYTLGTITSLPKLD